MAVFTYTTEAGTIPSLLTVALNKVFESDMIPAQANAGAYFVGIEFNDSLMTEKDCREIITTVEQEQWNEVEF